LGQLFGGLVWVWVDEMDPRTTLLCTDRRPAGACAVTGHNHGELGRALTNEMDYLHGV